MDDPRPPKLPPPAVLAEDLCEHPRRRDGDEITRLRRPARRPAPRDDTDAA